MNRFFMAFVKAARFFATVLMVLGFAAVIGFLAAPELVWEILRWALIFLAAAAAAYLLYIVIKSYTHKQN